tara:strand:- start:94 stop:450 length:357 start_codon:yes stop_codon:yes gene_type:complete
MTLLNKSVQSAKSFFTNKALSDPIGLLLYPFICKIFFNYSDRITYDVLKEIINDQKLIGVLTGQWGDYGLPPKKSSFAMDSLVADHYLGRENYPNGSSRKIAETISSLIKKKRWQVSS